jgi:hypothetical protein
MQAGTALAADDCSSDEQAPSAQDHAAKAGAGAKLQASHFVSLRITNPAIRKRAEDGESVLLLCTSVSPLPLLMRPVQFVLTFARAFPRCPKGLYPLKNCTSRSRSLQSSHNSWSAWSK